MAALSKEGKEPSLKVGGCLDSEKERQSVRRNTFVPTGHFSNNIVQLIRVTLRGDLRLKTLLKQGLKELKREK